MDQGSLSLFLLPDYAESSLEAVQVGMFGGWIGYLIFWSDSRVEGSDCRRKIFLIEFRSELDEIVGINSKVHFWAFGWTDNWKSDYPIRSKNRRFRLLPKKISDQNSIDFGWSRVELPESTVLFNHRSRSLLLSTIPTRANRNPNWSRTFSLRPTLQAIFRFLSCSPLHLPISSTHIALNLQHI